MAFFRRARALTLFFTLVAGCSRYDGHISDLPADVLTDLQKRAATSAEEREKENNDPTEIIVGNITILNMTVVGEGDFFAPLLNNVHYVTQKDVIYDELNFREGDKIKKLQLYDAERYIRLLEPIKQAQIIQRPNAQTGKTDLVVVTQDKFSPQFTTGASGSGGYASYGMSIYEPSVLGRLYFWGLSYGRENFRDYLSAGVGKKRIGGSRWEIGTGATLGFANSQYNLATYGVTIAHPFYRNGQRDGFTFSALTSDGVNYDYYSSGIRRGRDLETGKVFDLIYRTHIENISAEYLYGIGVNNRIEFGPGFWHYVRRDYYIYPGDQYTLASSPELPVSAPTKAYYQGQQFNTHAATFAVNTRFGNFAPMKNFQRYLFTEDQFEGLRTSSKVIHADPALGLTDHYTSLSTVVSYQKNTPDQKWRAEIAGSRLATIWHNTGPAYPTDDMWTLDLRGFWFTGMGTIALRQFVAHGDHLTRDKRSAIADQFTRGFYYGSVYPAAGHLSSIEYRTPGWKIPYILIAGVVFFDYAGVGETLSTLSYSRIVGFGTRTMLHEFDNNVFRIDIGFNLDDPSFNLLNALQFGLSHTF